jgi:hypothetical protein
MRIVPYPDGYVCMQYLKENKIQHEIVPRHQARHRNKQLTSEGCVVIFTSFC